MYEESYNIITIDKRYSAIANEIINGESLQGIDDISDSMLLPSLIYYC